MLDAYEFSAATELQAWFAAHMRPSSNPWRRLASPLAGPVSAALRNPVVREALRAVDPVLRGGFTAAAASIPTGRIAASFGVARLADIRDLSLRLPDEATRSLGTRYAAGGAVQGGALNAAAVLPAIGTAAAIGLIGVDLVAVSALGMRLVADTAAHYGFDPTDDREGYYMHRALALVGADSEVHRRALLGELDVIAVEIAADAALEVVHRSTAQALLEHSLDKLGVKLVKRQLAVIVPTVGAVIGAGMNAWFLSEVDDWARSLYRARFLAGKQGGSLAQLTSPR